MCRTPISLLIEIRLCWQKIYQKYFVSLCLKVQHLAALSIVLPLWLVALLPHSRAQVLKLPAIMLGVVVIALFSTSSNIISLQITKLMTRN